MLAVLKTNATPPLLLAVLLIKEVPVMLAVSFTYAPPPLVDDPVAALLKSITWLRVNPWLVLIPAP